MIDSAIKILMLSVFSVIVMAACDGSGSGDECVGEESCVCYPNSTCNGDLECRNGTCLPPQQDGDVTQPDGDETVEGDSDMDTDPTDPDMTEEADADQEAETSIPCPSGSETCPCYPNHTCNEGLVCMEWVCRTAPDGDTDVDSDTDAVGDAEPDIDEIVDNEPDVIPEAEPESDAVDMLGMTCITSAECDAGLKSGYVCTDSVCTACDVDAQCLQDPYYGADAVCSPRGRCVVEESCMTAGCDQGFMCDETTGRCRAPLSCDAVDCAPRQLCQEATDSQDARCLSRCEDGYAWNPIWSICEQYKPNCKSQAPASILDECSGLLRRCVQTDEDAHCGDCLPGRREADGICVPVLTCVDIDCDSEHRVCIAETDTTDASCGQCQGGYAELFGECQEVQNPVCDPAPATGSIFSQCRSLNRVCDDTSGSAVCDACLDGYVENPETGMCDITVTCEQLRCGDIYRGCDETPNGHCTGCSAPFVENTLTGVCECPAGMLLDENSGTCETIRTCADIQAGCEAALEFCIEETATSHAYCSKCGYGQAWYKHLETCIPCAPCTRPGETGRIWPFASQQGHCVCETLPGYYHTESGTGGTRMCDADNDGWVSQAARQPLEMEEGTAERDNARCSLRYIDRVALINEDGGVKEISLEVFDFLTGAVPLYEPINRDRAEVLAIDTDYSHPQMKNYAPVFGRSLKPEELNPMTKICPRQNSAGNAQYADYNANDVPDIDETGIQSQDSDPERRLFSVFSYFVELHKGWFEQPAGEPYGRWVIREKVRSTAPSDTWAVSPGYPVQGGSDYWRVCKRFRDTGYSPDGLPYNYDFAQWSDPAECDFSDPSSWCGMTHHSQFKCMMVAADTDPDMPHHISQADLSGGYFANRCEVEPESFDTVLPDTANPHDPKIRCQEKSSTSIGDIVWAAARYKDYEDEMDDPSDPQSNYGKTYVRGCINECAESDLMPPESRCQGPEGITCNGVSAEFGRLTCLLPMSFSPVKLLDEDLESPAFYLGSPEDEPGRGPYEEHVVINYENCIDFEVSTYEVTQDAFESTMGYNPSRFSCGNGICPVEQVNWYEALAFANKRSYLEGLDPCYMLRYLVCADGHTERGQQPAEGIIDSDYCKDHGGIIHVDSVEDGNSNNYQCKCSGYRLPSDMEWELAARAGTDTAFYSGPITQTGCENDPALSSIGWYCGNSDDRTSFIGGLQQNALGLYDMSGNVAEWTVNSPNNWVDYEQDGILYGLDVNAMCLGDCWQTLVENVRIIKGGGWNRSAAECRSAARPYIEPSEKNYAVGFRVMRTIFGIPSSRYLHVHTPMTWQAAANHCRAIAPEGTTGHLLTLDDSTERDILYRFYYIRPSWSGRELERAWLGYSDNDTEGHFDLDGNNSYFYYSGGYWFYSAGGYYSTRWDSGQPHNDTALNCVETTLGAQHWYAIGCDSQREFICEFETAN